MDESQSPAHKASLIFKVDDPFIGFEKNDTLLENVDKKRKGLEKKKKDLLHSFNNEQDKLTEVNAPSIVNNSHVNKKSPKSLSSPETNSKYNRNVKSLKKDDVQSKETEPDLNFQPSLELTTPTFNLTSPSPSRSSSRKQIVDIHDPIYKLPFNYGWKRELVYRSDVSSSTNRPRNGDVYYYSPNNKKLRSTREIQEQLNLSLDENPLTIDSFTFIKQPIGLNDRSKEIIRDANAKIPKEDGFAVGSVRPKKVKSPGRHPVRTPARQQFDYDMSDDENDKSSSKMKVVFKNVKKSRSKKDKNNVEAIDTSIISASSSTSEYINDDGKAVQSSATSVVSSSKTDDIEKHSPKKKRRNTEINGSLREHIHTVTTMQSFNYMTSAMRHVFKYLKLHELLIASRVCVAWNMIANDDHLWDTVSLKNSMVRDWEKCIDNLCRRNSVVLDTRRMLIPGKPEEFEHFWSKFALALKNAKLLKCIELYRCPVIAVESAIYSLPQLTVLNATSLKNPTSSKTPHDFMVLNLNYLGQMEQLTELKIKGVTGIKLTNLPSFVKLVNLKTLALTSIKAFPKDLNYSLGTVTKNLEFLEIGDCECLHVEFAGILKKFTNLTSLRLENCVGKWNQIAKDVFSSIVGLNKLKMLELINIDFTDNVEDGLEKLINIKALLVIPAYISQSATTNCHLIDCLKKLSKTLTHFVWGITHELLRVTDLFIAQFEKSQIATGNVGCGLNTLSQKKRESSNNIPVLRTRRPRLQEGDDPAILEREREKDKSDNVDILSIPTLKTLLTTMMEHAKIDIVKVNFAGTNKVYLTEQFHDL